jgi:hypothetical protein
MERFTGAEPVVFAIAIGCDALLAFAHLAVAPVPFCAVKPAILFGLVGFLSRMFPTHSATRLLKSLDPTSPHVLVPACAPHELLKRTG